MRTKDGKTEIALGNLGTYIRATKRKNRKAFELLKHTCRHRKQYQPGGNRYICKKIKRMWHVWPCIMGDCPLIIFSGR